MMKKLGIIVGVFLSLVLILAIALEFFVDLDSYKGQIIGPIKTKIHRDVTIDNIDHTFWRGPGAAIQNITILEPDSSDFFVQIKEIVAKVKLLPLISKRVELSKIFLHEPVVVVKRNQDGIWNFNDLLGETAEASPLTTQETLTPVASEAVQQASPSEKTSPHDSQSSAETSSSPLSNLAIDSFNLRDGTVRVVDDMMQVTTELSNIDGDVQGIALDSPIRFQVSADMDGGTEGNIEASGQIGPLPADGSFDNVDLDVTAKLNQINLAHFRPYYQTAQAQTDVTIPEKLNATIQLAGNVGKQVTSTGNVSVGDVKVEVSGNVQQVKTDPKLDLKISSQEISWEKLIQLLPPAIGEQVAELGLSGLGSITILPKGTFDNLVISGEFDLSKSGIHYQKIFAKPEAVKTKLAFEVGVTPDSLNITSLNLAVGEFMLNASGTVSNFQEPVLALKLSSNEFPLKNLFSFFPEIQIEELKADGAGVLQASAEGTLDDLALQLTVSLDKSELSYSDVFQKESESPGNITLEARLGKDSVSIKKLLCNLGQFQLTTSGNITNFANPNLDLVIETNLFDVGALFAHSPIMTEKYLPKELSLEGFGKLRIVPVGALDKLTVSGSIDMSKGGIRFGEYFTKPKDIPGVVDFDTTITKDAVEIRRVQININDVLLDITGSISGLQQDAMLELSVTSNKFALNQLLPVSGMVVNPKGTTELHFVVKGPVDQINVASIVAAKLTLADVGFLLPEYSDKPVQHLNANVELQGQKCILHQFSAMVGESSVDGTATMAQIFTQPEIAFALHAARLNLDEFMSPTSQSFISPSSASPFQFVASTQTTPVPASQSPPSPKNAWTLSQISANGTVSIDDGQAKNVHFSDLSADVKIQEQVVRVENLVFSLYDGKYQGGVELDLSSPDDPKYAFHSELVEVDANRILSDSTSLSDVLYGMLFADASIQGQGFKTEQIAKTLSGDGMVKVEGGKFTTFDIWSQLGEVFTLLGSLGKSESLSRIGKDLSRFPNETQFSRFEGSFKLKDGRAGSSDMILEIPEQDMHIALLLNGEFGLDTSLDFIGKVRFARQSKYYKDIEKYFRDFKQDDGSIELPFPIPIGGTLLEPEINLTSAKKSITKLAGEIAKQAAKSQVEKAGKKLLKDLFKKK